jgi:AmmeMemoRadiSam system protein A
MHDQTEEKAFVELPTLARRAVETFICEKRIIPPPVCGEGSPLRQRAACFVCLKTLEGHLRGCIGTVEPTKQSLAEEIIANAISAATRDPRFPPVKADELPLLRFSVDVLSPPEPATLVDLHPKIYGVIVQNTAGTKRGLLLPDIPGVLTAEQQLLIAMQKAEISPEEGIRIFRFRVRRFHEVIT